MRLVMLSALIIIKNEIIVAKKIKVFSNLLLVQNSRLVASQVKTKLEAPNAFGCVVMPIQRGFPKSLKLMPTWGNIVAARILATAINKNSQNNHRIKLILLSIKASDAIIEINKVDDRKIKFFIVSDAL